METEWKYVLDDHKVFFVLGSILVESWCVAVGLEVGFGSWFLELVRKLVRKLVWKFVWTLIWRLV